MKKLKRKNKIQTGITKSKKPEGDSKMFASILAKFSSRKSNPRKKLGKLMNSKEK